MENPELQKSKAFILAETLDYIPHAIVVKTIFRKITGNISMLALDAGEVLKGRNSPFDNFIQVIEGKVEVIIDNNSNILELGQSIIIPANTLNSFKANMRFKLLSTVIKSGYED